MIIELFVPDSIPFDDKLLSEFRYFLQGSVNRILVGGLRYGEAHRRKRYMRRLSIELRAYKSTGNFEQLLNIANYAFLESYAPENPKLHFDPTQVSATRPND